MKRYFHLASAALLLAGVAACNPQLGQQQPIALPEGDAERGQAIFVELQCNACHTVRNAELPASEVEGPVTIVLGGNVSKVKSYSELVTSIINPSHKLARNIGRQQLEHEGESVMTNYNDVMTVSELIDLTEFLQSQYEVAERPRYRYPVYTY